MPVNRDKTQPGYRTGARAQANPSESSRKQTQACPTARMKLGHKARLCVLGQGLPAISSPASEHSRRGDGREGRWARRGRCAGVRRQPYGPAQSSRPLPGRHRAHRQHGEEARGIHRGDQKCWPGRGAGVRGGPSRPPGRGRATVKQAGRCLHSEQGLMCSFPPQAKVTANNDKNRTFSVWYVPEVTGTHKVSPQPKGRLVGEAVAGRPGPCPHGLPLLGTGHRALCRPAYRQESLRGVCGQVPGGCEQSDRPGPWPGAQWQHRQQDHLL